MKIRHKFLFFLLLLFLTGHAFSQGYRVFQDELNDIKKNTKWALGPLRIYPLLRLRNVGYDDNVYYQRKEDHPISDYTGTVSPEVRFYLPYRGILILYFFENPEYVFFLKERNQRAFTNSYLTGMKYLLLHRFVFSGDFHFDEHRRRISSELGMQTTDRISGFTFSLFYETARKTSLGFRGSINHLNYEDIQTPQGNILLSQALDREEISGHLEFYYQIFWDNFFFIKAGRTEYQFQHVESSWRDASSLQVDTGIRFPLLGKVRGILSLGYKKFIPQQKGNRGFSGVVGNTELDMRTGRFGFRLGYSRDHVFSYSPDLYYFIENRYSAGISFYLTRFLRFDYNFEDGKSDYLEHNSGLSSSGEQKEIQRRDKHRLHSAGLVFRIIRNTGLGLLWNSAQWTSNVPGLVRQKNFIGAYLTYQF